MLPLFYTPYAHDSCSRHLVGANVVAAIVDVVVVGLISVVDFGTTEPPSAIFCHYASSLPSSTAHSDEALPTMLLEGIVLRFEGRMKQREGQR